MRRRVVVVAGACLDGDRILLARRPEGKHLAGLWEFPGGKLEAGESPEAALVREFEEELGVRARIDLILDAVHFAYEEFDLLMLLYAVAIEGDPRPVEVAAVEWFSFADALRLPVPPADVPLMQRLPRYATLLRGSGIL